MDLFRSFQVFQKVAELGSFSRAAESLGVVPSAVSRQINELEEWSGLRLINRTTRTLHLTAEGQIYLEKLSHITAEVTDLKMLGESERNLAGQIKLTSPVMLGQLVLPNALGRFKKANPKVEISMTLLNRMVDIVEEGFDVAVRGGQLPVSSLIAKKVGQIRMSMVACPSYLDQYGQPDEPKHLAGQNCLINGTSERTARWAFLADGKEMNVKVKGDMSANDSLSLKALSLSGLGIARIPHAYVREEIEAGTLVEVLPEFAPPALPIHIIYPSGRLMRPTLRAFIDFIAEDLREQLSA